MAPISVQASRYNLGIDPSRDGHAEDISAQDIYSAALSEEGIPKAASLLLAIAKDEPGKMGPLVQEITRFYKNDPQVSTNIPKLLQREILRQICAQNPAARTVDLARNGETSALLLITYPNSSHAGYKGGTVVDDLQDDLVRKKAIYQNTYGIYEDNLAAINVEEKSSDEVLALIGQEIERAISGGQEEFLLEYTAHGIAGGTIRIGNGQGLSGTQLAQFLNQYADRIKLTVVSHTCRGAWQLAQMQEIFAQNPRLKGVTIYTASDFNPETGQFRPEEQIFSSQSLSQNIDNPFDYYFALAYETDSNTTYAQARLFASRMTYEQFATLPLCTTIEPQTANTPSQPYDFPASQMAYEGILQSKGSRISTLGNFLNFQSIPVEYNPATYFSHIRQIF